MGWGTHYRSKEKEINTFIQHKCIKIIKKNERKDINNLKKDQSPAFFLNRSFHKILKE